MAAAMALPRGLGEVAQVLGLATQKDVEGARLMQQMARPRKYENGEPVWWDVPEKLARLCQYCETDVEVERLIEHKLRPLGDNERKVYVLDQKINDRGVHLDRELAGICRQLVDEALDRANDTVAAMTDDEVEKITQTGALRAWLNAQGVETDSVSKAAVADLLSRGDLPNAVRMVLEARQEAGKSSVAKIQSMLAYADPVDDRMRGMLLYHGAATGRWSGKGPQPQNMPRGEVKVGEKEIELLKTGSLEAIEASGYSPFALVSSALRPMFCAQKGWTLVAGDFSAIEARVLAWCAGEEWLLELFRTGGDPYKAMAAEIYHIPVEEVDKPKRQLGKGAILGCGFSMGGPKFVAQAAAYGVEIDEVFATQVVEAYRKKHPKIVQWWNDVSHAALMAVKNPGKVFTAGPVRYASTNAYLWCLLPSGRRLCYPSPRVVKDMTDWGYEREVVVTYGVDSRTRKWGPQKMWRGLWVENIVQAIARDLIAEALIYLDEGGWYPILSVHDEIVCDVSDAGRDGEELARWLEKEMSRVPSWAEGLPIAAEAWAGERYQK